LQESDVQAAMEISELFSVISTLPGGPIEPPGKHERWFYFLENIFSIITQKAWNPQRTQALESLL